MDRLSELKQIFKRKNFHPGKRLGQNFCIDPNLLASIPRRAEVSSDDLVLEVGTGTGLLTKFLAQRAGFVFSIEIDGLLIEIAREYNSEADNVEFFHGDVLMKKSMLEPAVVSRISKLMQEKKLGGFKLVSNLPFSVATPVIMNTLALARRPDSMTFLIQKELADKIAARHGRKTFSAISVLLQAFYNVRVLKVFQSEVFWPRPAVSSALVKMDLRETPLDIENFEHFSAFARRLFQNRRKNLKNALLGFIPAEIVPQVLDECGLSPGVRAEAVPLKTIIRLGNRCYELSRKDDGK